MALQSKMTVYAAIAGVLTLMGGIIYYASLDNVDLDQVEIELTNVEFREVSTINNQAKFDVTFLVKNPSDKTFTVSVIEYNLYADGTLLGSGIYSTADIALPGRALFSAGAEIPLKNIFVINKGDVESEIYDAMINNRIASFSAEGSITTQSSWSEAQKEFKTGY
ncbi:MAG: hypothetical protein OEW55_00695 [Nitrosopumilus sp.]|nr:hypothetical protein [Nitrosopumilus sp.]